MSDGGLSNPECHLAAFDDSVQRLVKNGLASEGDVHYKELYLDSMLDGNLLHLS